jgi:hypothetical protein
MVQSGQAAKSIKKKTDAMPKASTKKLLKDAALNAAMFVGPGKFLKAGKVVNEAVKVVEAAKKAKLGPKRKPLERIPSTKAVALEPKPNVGGGLRTTTGQGRKPLPAKDVTDIAKERTKRPNNAGRARDVKKPSTKELTPNEKRYEEIGKRARVTITKKKPISLAKIKKTKVQATEKKFDKMKPTSRPKPKPNRAPLKPIDRSRGSNAPVKPKLNDEQQVLDNAANNPLNSMYGGKPKPNIAEGRGNVQQPPSVTTSRIRSTSRQLNRERRKAKQANVRDKLTDIRESSTPGFEKLQPVRRGVPRNAEQRAEGRANAEARARLAAKAKKGSKMSKRSTTNDPRNAASDAGNMRERLRAIDAKTIANRKRRAIGKGGNKISPELKAKVEATLNSGKTARKGKSSYKIHLTSLSLAVMLQLEDFVLHDQLNPVKK